MNGSGRAGAGSSGFRSSYVGGTTKGTGFEGAHVDDDGYETVVEWECSPGCAVLALGGQSGLLKTGTFKQRGQSSNTEQPGGWKTAARTHKDFVGDEGTAARYFKQVKP
jgi:hypothetical protein